MIPASQYMEEQERMFEALKFLSSQNPSLKLFIGLNRARFKTEVTCPDYSIADEVGLEHPDQARPYYAVNFLRRMLTPYGEVEIICRNGVGMNFWAGDVVNICDYRDKDDRNSLSKIYIQRGVRADLAATLVTKLKVEFERIETEEQRFRTPQPQLGELDSLD